LIAVEAHAHHLEIELVLAVIRIESRGYNFAVSPVGALGLMQLMPATGRELALREGIPWNGDDTLFDPTVNVRLGIAYLEQLATRYGDVETALAAYNWGPGRIDRKIRNGAGVPRRYTESVMRVYVDARES
jgi:soluble lytic murein transglycosylase